MFSWSLDHPLDLNKAQRRFLVKISIVLHQVGDIRGWSSPLIAIDTSVGRCSKLNITQLKWEDSKIISNGDFFK